MRGFDRTEYRARTQRAQRRMAELAVDALLLTTEPEVRYFSGFLTRFWESPTRPWFLVVPAQGDPVAVIPSIGAALMGRTWIKDIRTWSAPDLSDDGVSLLADTLREVVADKGSLRLFEAELGDLLHVVLVSYGRRAGRHGASHHASANGGQGDGQRC